jgi:hypothetical protein
MEQTAVEWLVDKLKSQGLLIGEIDNLVAVKQAKELDKQEKHAEYMRGWKDGYVKNETFKTE